MWPLQEEKSCWDVQAAAEIWLKFWSLCSLMASSASHSDSVGLWNKAAQRDSTVLLTFIATGGNIDPSGFASLMEEVSASRGGRHCICCRSQQGWHRETRESCGVIKGLSLASPNSLAQCWKIKRLTLSWWLWGARGAGGGYRMCVCLVTTWCSCCSLSSVWVG